MQKRHFFGLILDQHTFVVTLSEYMEKKDTGQK